jgi:hypothetical protein
VSGDEGLVVDEVVAIRETEKALLIQWGKEEHWIPKSVIHDDSEVFDADENSTGTLIVKMWYADKMGWS